MSINPNKLGATKVIQEVVLPDFLVGTGGWAYFKVPNKPFLKAYSELFNFVQVNYTFYEHPNAHPVERWRKTVPEKLHFFNSVPPRLNSQHGFCADQSSLRNILSNAKLL